MNKTFLTVGVVVVAAVSQAQSISYTGGTYSQNFDSLLNTGTLNPWTDGTSPLAGWYMRSVKSVNTENTVQYNAGDGSSNSGALYSFGTTGSTERALGSIGSGSADHIAYGMLLVNNTGGTLNTLNIAYTGEQWRDGNNVTLQSLSFSYNLGGTTIGADTQTAVGAAGYTIDPNFTRVAALDFQGPVGTTTARALDGNAAGNRTAISGSITGINWLAGQSLWVRWVDVNDAGNDHGLAIDDLSFSATGAPVPEPATLTALGLGALALIKRRRK